MRRPIRLQVINLVVDSRNPINFQGHKNRKIEKERAFDRKFQNLEELKIDYFSIK